MGCLKTLIYKGTKRKLSLMARVDKVDILALDSKIRERLGMEEKTVHQKLDKIGAMRTLASDDSMSHRIRRDLQVSIEKLERSVRESSSVFNYYTLETSELIEAYRKELSKPVTLSFTGKKAESNPVMATIVTAYMKIARKYVPTPSVSVKTSQIKCNNCDNCTEFETIDTNFFICLECGSQLTIIRPASSYKDTDRVNITTKYRYARRVHFKDSINQYQGKQNCTILPEVFSGLEREFKNHGLLNETAPPGAWTFTPSNWKFTRVTKENIFMFLKELGMNKHYENVNLIHYKLTGVKPDDISHLEHLLFDDFDTLTDEYDKEFKFGENAIERRSFINIQYVLYELLRRRRHPCKIEDFAELKTIDRKSFHDEICGTLFRKLGWNHTSLF